jgi:hypothetical protein
MSKDTYYTSPAIFTKDFAQYVANNWTRGLSSRGDVLVGWRKRYFTTVKDSTTGMWAITDKYDIGEQRGI